MVSKIRSHCCKSGFKSPFSPPHLQPGVTFKNGAPLLLKAGTKLETAFHALCYHLQSTCHHRDSPAIHSLKGTGINLSPVARVDLRKEATSSRIKESGDTNRVKGGGKNTWIQQPIGTQAAFTPDALLLGWILVGSAACLPVCLVWKITSLENEPSFW